MYMAKSSDVKSLMSKNFPVCPICLKSKGYDVLGSDNDYVSCKNCSATWQSDDFKECQELTKLKLTQNSPKYNLDGKIQIKKYYPNAFWLNWREGWKAEKEKEREKEIQELEKQDSLLSCPLCQSKMVHSEVKLRTGGWSGLAQLLPLGELGELGEELLPVEVHVCVRCGKIELMAPEKTRQRIIDRR
jgi:hypothetical protein